MSIMRYRSTKNQNEESGFSERQSSSNLGISKDTDLFKYAIQNIASSKFSEPSSMMKKKQKVSELQIPSQRNNYSGQQYENNEYYVEKPKKMSSRTMTPQQNSLIISNQNENMQLSKLEQTKLAIHQRMLQTQKKVDSSLNMFKADLKQMFDFMQQFSRKQDSKLKHIGQKIDKIRNENQSHMQNLVNQINTTIVHLDSKIQANKDDILSNKLNFSNMLQELKLNMDERVQELRLQFSQNKSKNVGAYSMTLKNSVHDLQLMQPNENYNDQVDSLKKQIETIKLKFYDLNDEVQQKFKNYKDIPTESQQKEKIDLQQSEQLNKKISKIEKMQQSNWQYFERQIKELKNVHFRMDILQENQQGMNDQMQRVLNFEHRKRLDMIQSQLKFIQEDMPKKIKQLHQQAFKQKTQKIPVLKVRKMTKFEQQKVSKLSGEITHKQTYFLDEDGYLLDSQGVYLLDEQKQRIKILEDQLYFLQVQGIEIKQLA